MLTGEGTATLFFAVDHCTSECIGIHAARHGTPIEALEPIRQGVRAGAWSKLWEGTMSHPWATPTDCSLYTPAASFFQRERRHG